MNGLQGLGSQPPAIPYVGARPFRGTDEPFFAGRDQERRRLQQLVGVYAGVLLYGDSGTGKTSLINAGILPEMIREGYSPHRIRIRPEPGGEFALESITWSDGGEPRLPSAFGGTEFGADQLVAAVVERTAQTPIVVVFDQFEELFTLFARDVHPHRMIDPIIQLMREPLHIKLLFVFREDFLGRVRDVFAAAPDLLQHEFRLIAVRPENLAEIIRRPFDVYPGHFSHELSPELAQRLAVEFDSMSGWEGVSLTSLQLVCLQLWNSEDPDSALSGYGVQGLLEQAVEEQLERLPSALARPALFVLGRLVTAAGTRNVVAGGDLMAGASGASSDVGDAEVREALHLLTTETGLVRRERRRDIDLYELTSEFFIPWIRERLQSPPVRRASIFRRRRRSH